MNIAEAIDRALEEPTLTDALSFICIWEMERIVKYVRNNPGSWESCFKICISSVTQAWEEKHASKTNTTE